MCKKEQKTKPPKVCYYCHKEALNKIVRGFFRGKKMNRESPVRVIKRAVRRALVGMYGEKPRGIYERICRMVLLLKSVEKM